MNTTTLDTTAVRQWRRFPGYKDSGLSWLGEIPRHWDTVRLKYIVSLVTSGSRGWAEFYSDQGATFLRIGNLSRSGIDLDLRDIQRVTPPKVAEAQRTRVCPGDVLISVTAFIGSVGVVPDGLGEAYVNQHLALTRPRKEKIDPGWLCYCLLSAVGQEQFRAALYGGTKDGLGLDDVKELVVLLPPLQEQRAIAAFLDREAARIDTLIGHKEQLIALLEEKRQAVISHAVTRGLDPAAPFKDSGIPWLGRVPKHWRIKRLKMLIRPGTSISYGIVQPGNTIPDGVPFVQTTNMTSGDFALDSLSRTSAEIAASYPRSRLMPGDLLLGIRASIGAAHIVPHHLEGANLSRGVARIVLGTEVRADFVCQYLRSRCAEEYWALAKQGSTFNEVSIETVRELPVLVPPGPEQEEIVDGIVARCGPIEQVRSLIQTQIGQLQEYRTALISVAVTGQIDVRGEV